MDKTLNPYITNNTRLYGYLQTDKKEVVWVNKRYIPTELRSTAPVPRHKFLNDKPQNGKAVTSAATIKEWMKPIISPPINAYQRPSNDEQFSQSSPANQCQEWSTLRQMLPSKGTVSAKAPPLWGTGQAEPISFRAKRKSRFPKINSPMTSYVDAAHVTNRLFTFQWNCQLLFIHYSIGKYKLEKNKLFKTKNNEFFEFSRIRVCDFRKYLQKRRWPIG